MLQPTRVAVLHLDTGRLDLTVSALRRPPRAEVVARYARPCSVAADLEQSASVRRSTLSHTLVMIEGLLLAAAQHHAVILALATRAFVEAPGLADLLGKLDAWYDVRVEPLSDAGEWRDARTVDEPLERGRARSSARVRYVQSAE